MSPRRPEPPPRRDRRRDGDLTQRITDGTRDEVAQTAAGFERLADRMQRLVAEVAGSVEQVARSADELTELSSRLAAAENGTGP